MKFLVKKEYKNNKPNFYVLQIDNMGTEISKTSFGSASNMARLHASKQRLFFEAKKKRVEAKMPKQEQKMEVQKDSKEAPKRRSRKKKSMGEEMDQKLEAKKIKTDSIAE